MEVKSDLALIIYDIVYGIECRKKKKLKELINDALEMDAKTTNNIYQFALVIDRNRFNKLLEKIDNLIIGNERYLIDVNYNKMDSYKTKITKLISFFEFSYDLLKLREKQLKIDIENKQLSIEAIRNYKKISEIYKTLDEIKVELIEILEDNGDFCIKISNKNEVDKLIKSLRNINFFKLNVPNNEILSKKIEEDYKY